MFGLSGCLFSDPVSTYGNYGYGNYTWGPQQWPKYQYPAQAAPSYSSYNPASAYGSPYPAMAQNYGAPPRSAFGFRRNTGWNSYAQPSYGQYPQPIYAQPTQAAYQPTSYSANQYRPQSTYQAFTPPAAPAYGTGQGTRLQIPPSAGYPYAQSNATSGPYLYQPVDSATRWQMRSQAMQAYQNPSYAAPAPAYNRAPAYGVQSYGAQPYAGGNVHMVQRGDTLIGISKAYQVPLSALYQANPQANRFITPGQQIIIPGR